jgi:pyruvate/2-oxoglutarate dehydrogenase complex dihydrolipoamide dehydrogenase (E3) component
MSGERIVLPPDDAHNRRMVSEVHPADWVNPPPQARYDLVVIGGGTAGLVSAIGGAGLGARVALIERHFLGGDCLVSGCVPSKALLASAHTAHAGGGTPDFGAVMERLRRLRADISPHDSAARCKRSGVDVFLGDARFTDRTTVQVGDATLRFRKAVIATGARAALPSLPGLEATGYRTNESIFNLTERPARLLVLGSGPVGMELAQGFQRLGSQVTLIERGARLLPREDADAAAALEAVLRAEGVDIRLETEAVHFEGKRAVLRHGGAESALEFDEVLVAAGRTPNVEGMGLETAGVEFDTRKGVRIDDTFRTTNPRVFACGDVAMDQKFTHAADFAARSVIRNALFPFLPKARLSKLVIPHCIYTSPELAHVGHTAESAREARIEIDTYTLDLSEVDRAILEEATTGFARVHCRKGTGTIIGATLLAPHAGESIGSLTLALQLGIPLGKIAATIHPYPTQAEAIRRLGDQYNKTKLTPRTAAVLRWIARRGG